MQKAITVCALFGITAAAAVILHDALQYKKATQAAYKRGWNEGTAKMQYEAVHNGHGLYRCTNDQRMLFEWKDDTLDFYAPAREARAKQEAILPEQTDWLTRLLQ